MRSRLFLQIYGAVLLVGFCCIVVVSAMAWTFGPAHRGNEFTQMAELLLEVPPEALPGRLKAISSRLGAHVTYTDPDGEVVQTGPAHPRSHGLTVSLSNGSTLLIRSTTRPPIARFFLALFLLMLAVAVGCYPLARRLSHRLEALQQTAIRWGEGDLRARVEVKGTDEIADVATGFNRAADRVQGLIEAQRRVLASTSHELRSPLARIRMAIELLQNNPRNREQLFAQTVQDIEELDQTIGELLQVGRMQSVGLQELEEVELLELLRDEGAKVGAVVRGSARRVRGEPRLLRRLVRNLLENAKRHGGGTITAETEATGFRITDHGPGISPDQHEQIFEPFYRAPGHAEGRDGGVGLGLWLSREIATHHGGSLVVDASHGTSFVCTLPTA